MKNNPFENFTENDCIACPTQDIFNQIRALNPNDNCKDKHWETYKEETQYTPFFNGVKGAYGPLNHAKQKGFTIHQPEQFLKPQFDHLEEIEVSRDGKEWFLKNLFIGFLSGGLVVTENKINKLVGVWNYARKINNERNEAIAQIKELMEKFNIKKEEL